MPAGHTHDPPFRAGARPSLIVRVALVTALIATAALIVGCGSSSSHSSSSGGGSSNGGSSSGATATVKVAKISGYGPAVVTAAGKSVYLLSTDPAGTSKCEGSCAKTWIPVTVSGSPPVGSGVDSSKLSSFKRSDGTTQVLYDKHALYTHAGEGATSGEGQAADGGIWYLVAPSGSAIKKSSSGGY
jgi:predicted lipoprotein with Yx(FWY)xxD motif